jgi:hypothetical protein
LKGKPVKSKYPKFRTRRYRVYTYDVWGNARDGFDVNDVYRHGTVDIRCKLEVYNEGTEHEFAAWIPTDRQLSIACGCRGVSWDNGADPDHLISCEDRRNGKPVGEVRFEEWVDE